MLAIKHKGNIICHGPSNKVNKLWDIIRINMISFDIYSDVELIDVPKKEIERILEEDEKENSSDLCSDN